jgi:hypothetical protein
MAGAPSRYGSRRSGYHGCAGGIGLGRSRPRRTAAVKRRPRRLASISSTPSSPKPRAVWGPAWTLPHSGSLGEATSEKNRARGSGRGAKMDISRHGRRSTTLRVRRPRAPVRPFVGATSPAEAYTIVEAWRNYEAASRSIMDDMGLRRKIVPPNVAELCGKWRTYTPPARAADTRSGPPDGDEQTC